MNPQPDGSKALVYVRIRPACVNNKENEEPHELIAFEILQNRRLLVPTKTLTEHKPFDFDGVFGSVDGSTIPESQTNLYQEIGKPLLEDAFRGINSCLFAYGQTNSGKTYSISGSDSCPGIIPLLIEDIFAKKKQIEAQGGKSVSIRFSYYEIYNEKVKDLLDSTPSNVPLLVREDPEHGPHVKNLTIVTVENLKHIMHQLRICSSRKATTQTCFNEQSSRSHCIFTLYISLSGIVNIVDLAGSEKYANIQDSYGSVRQKESIEINKSLFTLRRVLEQLSENSTIDAPLDSPLTTILPLSTPIKSASSLNVCTPRSAVKKRKFVSYRDSVLTWLLKDSLGGNSKIVMLATVSPFKENLEETMLTIRYAQVTKQMVNIVQVNEDHRGRFVRELIAERDLLKKQLQLAHEPKSPLNGLLKSLQQQVVERELEISNLTKQLKAFVECPKPQSDATMAESELEEDLLVDACTSPMIVEDKRHLEMGMSPMMLKRQENGQSLTPMELSDQTPTLLNTINQLQSKIKDLSSELFECQTDLKIMRDQALFYKDTAQRANANLDKMVQQLEIPFN
ncbi:hypothetical protein Ciccas_011839 [Cichlidogyrus casuarinus]|uniref:Kinesin motor domain-containing protein n=1 Tax=Cichlidogyrus casuarinus TaxID=1844966 RepID=A0ABD2PRC6_9PLAT